MNAFGVDVSRSDAATATAFLHGLFWLGLALIVLQLWRGRLTPRGLAVAVGAAAIGTFAATIWPLQRIYGLGVGWDRLNQVGLVSVVAAGHSPLQTAQVGHLHFEPFWGFFVAVLSGFDVDRVLALYPFLPLIPLAGFSAALWWAWGQGRPPEERWEAALMTAAGALLVADPLDSTGVYRDPWSLTFLLKPNHALGLILVPVVARLVATAESLRARLFAGLVLHVLGWVFVIHMALMCVAVTLFAVLTPRSDRGSARNEIRGAAVVLSVNAVVVSPYLVMLLLGYPFLAPTPEATIPAESAHWLEVIGRQAPLFGLGVIGAMASLRRANRLDRMLASIVAAGLVAWALVPVLSWLQVARERDEIFYWCRFWLAVAAGRGAWLLTAASQARLARRAALIVALGAAWALPAWWDPMRLDAYSARSVEPLSEKETTVPRALRALASPPDVVAGDRDAVRWVAALTGLRVLRHGGLNEPRDGTQREDLEHILVSEADSAKLAAAAGRYGVRFVVLTPAWIRRARGPSVESILARPHYRERARWSGPGGEFIVLAQIVDPNEGTP